LHIQKTVHQTYQPNPLATSANQEQLVLAVHFWVASQQHLQLTFDDDQVIAAMALNRAQIMQ